MVDLHRNLGRKEETFTDFCDQVAREDVGVILDSIQNRIVGVENPSDRFLDARRVAQWFMIFNGVAVLRGDIKKRYDDPRYGDKFLGILEAGDVVIEADSENKLPSNLVVAEDDDGRYLCFEHLLPEA